MEIFNSLGTGIEELWRAENYNEEKFPEIAAAALKAAELTSKITAWDVIEWTLGQTFLPEQQDLRGNFGDPPITIYNSPRFHIDVYFWLEGTTAIHQHAFCGAFQVLHGSSIHSWYEFERSEAINTFTEIGSIDLKLCELLTVGDVQAINAGKRYIHALFHLEQPSATIVVRTNKSPAFLPQFSYFKPFLAIDPFFEEPNTTKKLQCVASLMRIRHPDADEYVRNWLRNADFQTSFQILQTVRALLRGNQMDQLFKLSTSADRFADFLKLVSEIHGERANVFPAVFAHLDKQDEILRRRGYVTDPEHRFFLALLLNVDGRDAIFSLVRERFPESDPLDKVLDWLSDLGRTRIVGGKENALGIDAFDDTDVSILEIVFRGIADNEIQGVLTDEFGSATVENLAERLTKLRRSAILQPLI